MEQYDSESNQTESLAELNLKTLQEFGTHINSAVNSKFIFDNLLFTCMAKFLTTRSAIYLHREGKLELCAVKGIDENTIEKKIILSKEFSKETIVQDKNLNEFAKKHDFALIECISTSRSSLGIILLGKKSDSNPYSDDDIKFLRTILNISAPAIENLLIVSQLQNLNRALNTKISQVNALFELSKEFSLLLDEQNICKLLSYTIMGYMMVTKYVIALKVDNRNLIIDKNINALELDSVIEKIDWNKIDSATIVHPLEDSYSNDLLKIGIQLIVPMQIRTKTIGLIFLGAKSTKQEYSESDKEFLESLGSIA
ncbi:MAG: GAF domain-containing protein, partial [Ignavibacteria bacterium]|nr:GAF domain-containing protein [Ignavibacteria bacterium]